MKQRSSNANSDRIKGNAMLNLADLLFTPKPTPALFDITMQTLSDFVIPRPFYKQHVPNFVSSLLKNVRPARAGASPSPEWRLSGEVNIPSGTLTKYATGSAK